MELEQFTTNEQVEGSSPFVPSKTFRLRSSMESERRSSKPDVASSSLAGAAISITNFKLQITNVS